MRHQQILRYLKSNYRLSGMCTKRRFPGTPSEADKDTVFWRITVGRTSNRDATSSYIKIAMRCQIVTLHQIVVWRKPKRIARQKATVYDEIRLN